MHVNESLVVLHVQTYELQSIQIVALVLKCVISFFYDTNKIILLCEDLIAFLFSFVAVLFLLLPKRLSKGLFLVFEPVEMVIDLLYMQAHQKGYNREHYKGIEVFI